MPEGDTIFRTAEVLRTVLDGSMVTAARAQPRPGLRSVPDLSRVVAARITSVEARGKHLLIGFDNGLTLRTHMRMAGSWHRYRPGEPWRLPARRATVVLETTTAVAVCFDAPVAELLTPEQAARSEALQTLGPDLLARDFDADEALHRLRERGSVGLGEALLDQRAVAGIGNVYRSEVCFIEGVNPWRPVADSDDATLRGILATARRLLQANSRGGARTTTGRTGTGSNLWVYGRAGRPCRRCGTRVESRRSGELARVAYWCPRCQPP